MKKTKLFKLLIFIAVSILLVVFFYRQQKQRVNSVKNEQEPTINVNFLGTESPQQVYITYPDDQVLIEVKDNDKIIASAKFENSGLRKASELKAVKFKVSEPKEYLHWTQVVGPHQFESFFLTINNEQVVFILGADLEDKLWYSPFWTSRGSEILVKDIDGDGLKEVVEFVDEFPPNAPRLVDAEVEKITKEKFKDDLGDSVWKIVSRENSGKGRGFRVVWNIYSFVDVEKPYFKKLTEKEYDAMVKILLKDSPAFLSQVSPSVVEEKTLFTPDPEVNLSDTISRNQLTKDSIEFNEFVREFWAGGYYQEPFGEHKPEIK